MFSIRKLETELRRACGEARCQWCGASPRLRVTMSMLNGFAHFTYKCHHKYLRVTVDDRLRQYDPQAFIDAAWNPNPFPLPKVPARLNPVRPRGFVVQADGTRAWVMGPSE